MTPDHLATMNEEDRFAIEAEADRLADERMHEEARADAERHHREHLDVLRRIALALERIADGMP